MSTISYLQLDANYDPIFDPTVALVDLDAVTQAIKTRLLLFTGEWWEDLNEGTPMFTEILGQPASAAGQQVMSLALVTRISGTPYVSAVQDVNMTFNPADRNLSFSCTVQTPFGATPMKVGNISGVSQGFGNEPFGEVSFGS